MHSNSLINQLERIKNLSRCFDSSFFSSFSNPVALCKCKEDRIMNSLLVAGDRGLIKSGFKLCCFHQSFSSCLFSCWSLPGMLDICCALYPCRFPSPFPPFLALLPAWRSFHGCFRRRSWAAGALDPGIAWVCGISLAGAAPHNQSWIPAGSQVSSAPLGAQRGLGSVQQIKYSPIFQLTKYLLSWIKTVTCLTALPENFLTLSWKSSLT